METVALFNLRDQTRAGLYPSITKRISEEGEEYETDFYTEVLCFHSGLVAVFYELENNSTNYSAEAAGKYVGHATNYLTEIRDRLRNFFPEDKEYQTQVRQISSANISDEPYLNYTPADSISDTKLEYPVKEIAIYANRVCQWGLLLLQKYSTEKEIDIKLPELKTINEKLLLLKFTGAIDTILNLCEGNQTKAAKLLSAIIDEDSKALRTSINYINRPQTRVPQTPFTDPALTAIMNLFTILKLDTTAISEIYKDIFSKNEKL